MSSSIYCFNFLQHACPQVHKDSWDKLDNLLIQKMLRLSYLNDSDELPNLLSSFPSMVHPLVHSILFNAKYPSLKKKTTVWMKDVLQEYRDILIKKEPLYPHAIFKDLISFLQMSQRNPEVFDLILSFTKEFTMVQDLWKKFIQESLLIAGFRGDFFPDWESLSQMESFLLRDVDSWEVREIVKIPPSEFQSHKEEYVRVTGYRENKIQISFVAQSWLSQRFWKKIIPTLEIPEVVPSLFYSIRASTRDIKKVIEKYPFLGSGLFKKRNFTIEELSVGPELSFYRKWIEDNDIEKTLMWAAEDLDKLHWLTFNTFGSVMYRKTLVRKIVLNKIVLNSEFLIKFGVSRVFKSKNIDLVFLLEKHFRNLKDQEAFNLLTSYVSEIDPDEIYKNPYPRLPQSIIPPLVEIFEHQEKIRTRRNLDKLPTLGQLRLLAIKSSEKKVKLKGIFNT